MNEDSCYIKDFASASALIGVGSTAPSYNLLFHKEGKEIGKLDFNGPTRSEEHTSELQSH